jgi:hypothetical protein
MKFEAIIEVDVKDLETRTETRVQDIDMLIDLIVNEFEWLVASGIVLLELKGLADRRNNKDE